MNIFQALSPHVPRIVSVVGGGGKTSFIFTLAREAAARGSSVLVTTTTAMFNPEKLTPGASGQSFDRLYTGPAESLAHRACGPGGILVAANGLTPENHKLAGYSPDSLSPALDSPAFDLVLVEADGARMRPVKAPAGHEPVVPPRTDTLAGCIGLDCLGRPLDEAVAHRPDRLARLGGQAPGSPITEKTLAGLAASDQGIFKPAFPPAGPAMRRVLVLNKADSPQKIRQGRGIGKHIVSRGHAGICLVTCLRDSRAPVKAVVRP